MTEPILESRGIEVTFDIRPRGAWPWTPSRALHAVDGVSFTRARGETLGIVGESGSGKSTLARAIINTVPATAGEVLWQGKPLQGMDLVRQKDIQMIFQDPLASLNPRLTVGEIVAEPLTTHNREMPKAKVRSKVRDMLEKVGLLPNQINRYPHEFSGGQCQRIGIARALITEPKLVICDEPVSALDVSVQAQIVNLLKRLQAEMGLSLIFIAHDLSVVKHISDRILVMYLGRMMEMGPADRLVRAPQHPYTRALIASAPIPDPAIETTRHRVPLSGELPSPMAPPSGCVFRTRCKLARPACAKSVPALLPSGQDHVTACHFFEEQDAFSLVG